MQNDPTENKPTELVLPNLSKIYEAAETQPTSHTVIVNNYDISNSTINITSNSQSSRPVPNEHMVRLLNSKYASWIFGGLLFLLLIGLVLFGPDNLPAYRLMILGQLVAVFAGLFTFFFTGQMGLEVDFVQNWKDGWAKLGVRAISGIAVYAFALILWVNPWIGVLHHTDNVQVPPNKIQTKSN